MTRIRSSVERKRDFFSMLRYLNIACNSSGITSKAFIPSTKKQRLDMKRRLNKLPHSNWMRDLAILLVENDESSLNGFTSSIMQYGNPTVSLHNNQLDGS
jgi:hypothetical protein